MVKCKGGGSWPEVEYCREVTFDFCEPQQFFLPIYQRGRVAVKAVGN